MTLKKVETKYTSRMQASEYDYLEVTQDTDKYITVKFLDTRWRTKEETIALFREAITLLEQL